ncbi:MAG: S41 family peptidase [Salibacteraceae bacterium]
MDHFFIRIFFFKQQQATTPSSNPLPKTPGLQEGYMGMPSFCHFKLLVFLFAFSLSTIGVAQDYGDYPVIPKELLLRDLQLLHQGLDKFHSGMYWYTSKDSVDRAFERARAAITKDMSVLQFHKIVAPLVALSREDHTDIALPKITRTAMKAQASFLPLTVVFLGQDAYVTRNGSNDDNVEIGSKILRINGEPMDAIVEKLGTLFASDGYVESVKRSDLSGFSFARNYYYHYGNLANYWVEFEDTSIVLLSLRLNQIQENLKRRRKGSSMTSDDEEMLEFKVLNDSTAYLAVHSFGTADIRSGKTHKRLAPFLKKSFATIEANGIQHLILDLSENGGGKEGNENLVFSYLADNYQKYLKVRAKTQKAVLDNGTDKPIKLKTFGWLERTLVNKKMPDGSYERKESPGHGLKAYRKEPKYKFKGKLYVLVSPITYSGGSELANMLYTRGRATFIGQETGGGYYGYTSGYSASLTLPHSKIKIYIPALQFMMNVKKDIPFGRGVLPHHLVIPTFEAYQKGEPAALNFALRLIQGKE